MENVGLLCVHSQTRSCTSSRLFLTVVWGRGGRQGSPGTLELWELLASLRGHLHRGLLWPSAPSRCPSLLCSAALWQGALQDAPRGTPCVFNHGSATVPFAALLGNAFLVSPSYQLIDFFPLLIKKEKLCKEIIRKRYLS